MFTEVVQFVDEKLKAVGIESKDFSTNTDETLPGDQSQKYMDQRMKVNTYHTLVSFSPLFLGGGGCFVFF